jgi:hypothetical protein
MVIATAVMKTFWIQVCVCIFNVQTTDMNYEELVKNHSAEMIEKLVTWVVSQDPVEIHYDFTDDDQWAIISMHIYEEDQEISIRLHPDNVYDLYFGYYDEEDEFFEIIHLLTEEEKKILPDGLNKIMHSVLSKEEGMRIPGSFLSKK